MALENIVKEALNALYHHPDDAVRSQADHWLQNFQRTLDAWQVSDNLLHDASSNVETQIFCSQTLRSKVQRDFEELPSEAFRPLRDSLNNLLKTFHKGTPKVRTQISLAVAALAVQVPAEDWGDGGIMKWLRDEMNSYPDIVPSFLELLRVLPEEVFNYKIAARPDRRRKFEEELVSTMDVALGILTACLNIPELKEHDDEDADAIFCNMKSLLLKKLLQKWCSQDVFDDDNEQENTKMDLSEDEEDDDMQLDREPDNQIMVLRNPTSKLKQKKPQSTQSAAAATEDLEVVLAINNDSTDDLLSDESDYDVETKAEILACAKKMLRKKQRVHMLDDAYNKYMFHDNEGLPKWFIDEEKKHMQPMEPITKEEAYAMKAQFREINARPAKKMICPKCYPVYQEYNREVMGSDDENKVK